jgi:hypothetical protein
MVDLSRFIFELEDQKVRTAAPSLHFQRVEWEVRVERVALKFQMPVTEARVSAADFQG